MNLAFAELLRYTNDERDKWRRWFVGASRGARGAGAAGRPPPDRRQADRSHLPGRARHLQRLMDVKPSEQTGLTGNNAPPLFDYGASVRRELEQYVADLDDEQADQVRDVRRARADLADVVAQAALPHPAARDPALGADRARGPPRRLRAAGRSRSVLLARDAVIGATATATLHDPTALNHEGDEDAKGAKKHEEIHLGFLRVLRVLRGLRG